MDTRAAARRWMAGTLAATYLFDLLLSRIDDGLAAGALVPLPVAAAVFLGLRRPALGVVAGVGAVLATSALIRWTGAYVAETPGSGYLTATEAVGGGMLIAVAVWRGGRWGAAWAVPAVVLAAAAAMVLRAPSSGALLAQADYLVPAGVFWVLFTGGAGVALRMVDSTDLGEGTRELLRAQWPLAAVLGLVFLLDLISMVDLVAGPGTWPLFLAQLAAAGLTAACAVLGPRGVVRWTLAAAVVMVLATAAVSVLGLLAGGLWEPMAPLTAAVSHMALVAYAVRHAEPWAAARAVAALAAADLLAVAATTALGVGTGRGVREFLLLAAFLLLLSAAAGQYLRGRDRERRQSVRVAVTGAQQAERMALARELHDVVAHHVTGIVVQAQAARLVADTAPEAALAALDRIERSGGEALAAMRVLVGSMRGSAPAGGGGAAGEATTDLAADLRALAGNVTGPEVRMELDLPDTLPLEAGRSVLRLVQESLTNVTKHAADAREVLVRIDVVDGELRVRVSDDAETTRQRPAGGSGGYGLIGMRERVDLLGGRFSAGPGERAGWTVDAAFPLREDRP